MTFTAKVWPRRAAIAMSIALALATVGCDRFRSPHERGVRYLKVADYDGALAAFEVAVAEARAAGDDASLAIAYANRCYTLDALGRHDEAVSDCTESLALVPDDPEVLNNRGVAHLGAQRLDEAVADFAAAIELDEGYAAAYANRGRVHIDREDYTEALADLDRAIELDDTLGQAYANRAFVHDTLSDFDAALEDYSRAIEVSNDPQVYFTRGMFHLRYRRLDEAYEDFKAAAEIAPDDYIGYMASNQAKFLEGLRANWPTNPPPAEDEGSPAEDEG